MTNYLINEIKSLRKTSTMVSIVGGGGKTSTLYYLANQLKKEDSVLITTTTAMFHPHSKVDALFFNDIPLGSYKNQCVGLFSEYIDSKDKMIGVEKERLNQCKASDRFKFILNEADGARMKPLKSYADHEPVIPNKTDMVIVVIGADAIGRPLSDMFVHRIDEFQKITGLKIGETITMAAITKVLVHELGFLKDIPDHAKAIVIINKVKTYPLDFDIEDLASDIKSHTSIYEAVIFAELKDHDFISICKIDH